VLPASLLLYRSPRPKPGHAPAGRTRNESFHPRLFLSSCLALLLMLCGSSRAEEPATGGVLVNGKPLQKKQLETLRQRAGIPDGTSIPAGRYWYDKVSGLWGMRGGPTLGQIPAGLDLGGTLRQDASGGDTGVFINGRELHREEAAYLRRLFGTVNPGRYWLNPQGIGGYEGGPPLFHLGAAAAAGAGSGGYSGYTRRTPFGSIGGDGNCSYYMHPEGSSVLSCD